MKTILKRNHRAGATKLKLPRARLQPAPRSRQVFNPPVPFVADEPKPSPVIEEVIPAESLRGDTLQLYLREIGQVKLLTPAEELALARKIRRAVQTGSGPVPGVRSAAEPLCGRGVCPRASASCVAALARGHTPRPHSGSAADRTPGTGPEPV